MTASPRLAAVATGKCEARRRRVEVLAVGHGDNETRRQRYEESRLG